MRNRNRYGAALALGALLTLAAAGCAGPKGKVARPEVKQSGELDRSLFSKDPAGYMSEDAIQAILARPLEIELPARVGILPITPARDWKGPGPAHDDAPPAVAAFADELRGGEPFTMVTEMMAIPSGALGMEALREIAARYKLRYVILYRENITRKRKTNAWTLGYLTVVGALFMPGDTLEIDGYIEASMFDVKTGLLMFTARERVRRSRRHNPWHTDDKLAEMQRRIALDTASEMAREIRTGIHAYQAAVAAEEQRRSSPEAPATPADPAAEPTAETTAGPGSTASPEKEVVQ